MQGESGRTDRRVGTRRTVTGGALITVALSAVMLVGCTNTASTGEPSTGQPSQSSQSSTSQSSTSQPSSAGTSSTKPSSTASSSAASGPTSASAGPSSAASRAAGTAAAPSRAAGSASSRPTVSATSGGSTGGGVTSSPPSPGSTASTVPRRTQKANPPTKKLTETKSTVAPKLTAELSSLRTAQVNSRNPGEISGNAVIFVLTVTNNSGSALDLGNVVVTVAGSAGNPGSEITSAPAKPLSGTAQTGTTVRGTYAFVIPRARRNPISVNVTLTADTTIAVFKGNAS